jgi:hypothetical protein
VIPVLHEQHRSPFHQLPKKKGGGMKEEEAMGIH